jgi:hypothetical protein
MVSFLRAGEVEEEARASVLWRRVRLRSGAAPQLPYQQFPLPRIPTWVAIRSMPSRSWVVRGPSCRDRRARRWLVEDEAAGDRVEAERGVVEEEELGALRQGEESMTRPFWPRESAPNGF